jgi:hypothetical protein
MSESIFWSLRDNPPTLTVKENAREVILEMVSVMCDNRSLLKFKKNKDGEFRLNSPPRDGGCGPALSNYQFKHAIYDIEWAADEGDWERVFIMINSGTELIESVKSR